LLLRSICYFKTRGERRATKGDKGTRPSTTVSRKLKKRADVRWLTSLRDLYVTENLAFVLSFILSQERDFRK